MRRLLSGRDDVVEKKMVGGLSFLVNGNMCCDITGTALMIRVGADSREQAMREPHVRDALWEAFVVAMLATGPAVADSRYGISRPCSLPAGKLLTWKRLA